MIRFMVFARTLTTLIRSLAGLFSFNHQSNSVASASPKLKRRAFLLLLSIPHGHYLNKTISLMIAPFYEADVVFT